MGQVAGATVREVYPVVRRLWAVDPTPERAAGIAAGLMLLAVCEAADAVDHTRADPWFVLTTAESAGLAERMMGHLKAELAAVQAAKGLPPAAPG